MIVNADANRCDAINILFDGPPGPESGRFIEVENDSGQSINVGEWIERDDGLWSLRIITMHDQRRKQKEIEQNNQYSKGGRLCIQEQIMR